MPTYLDQDIAGDGQEPLSGSNVLFLIVHVTSLGDEARVPTPTVPDSIVRFGWIALGDTLDVIGESRIYWRDPLWINWTDVLWTPVPSTDAGGGETVVASQLRWHLGVGAAAHIYVYGT